MSKIFDELVRKRGYNEAFLHPKYSDGAFYLPDLDVAIKRIVQAIKKHETILVYGDYDVDGVTATAVMVEGLKMAGASEIKTMLPDRFIDGYGMSERSVERAKKEKASLVITVDCGTNNSNVITELKDAGVDTIVTDHHEVMTTIPADALAVVNPKRADFDAEKAEKYNSGESKYSIDELRELAGVGVAFCVVKALVKEGLVPAGQEKWLLDLVLIGTICDSMALTGINRELSSFGMIVLGKTRRVGLLELMKVAGVNHISAYAVGFQIGPRLNAGGRMESAETSLSLLLSTSKAEAARLAAKLDKLNTERREEQQYAMKEIDAVLSGRESNISAGSSSGGLSSNPNSGFGVEVLGEKVLVARGKWHEGVLGIIAGRMVEKYHKPSFVLAEVESVDVDADGVVEDSELVLKGSGRTFGDFNLADALRAVSDVTIKGGGHAAACGVQLKSADFCTFCDRLNLFYEEQNLKNQNRYLAVEADLETENLTDITMELMDELASLEPFGTGNEEPIFKVCGVVLNVASMGAGGEHLRVDLRDENGKIMKLISFNAPKNWFSLPLGEPASFKVCLDKSEWQGRTYIEGMIKEICTL